MYLYDCYHYTCNLLAGRVVYTNEVRREMERISRRNGRRTGSAWMLAFFVLLVVSGCASGGNERDNGSTAIDGGGNRNAVDVATGANAVADHEGETEGGEGQGEEAGDRSTPLLPEELPVYVGTASIAERDGEPYEATFMQDPMKPYGFYIPEGAGVEKRDFEDGSEWWMGERGIFTLFEEGQVLPDYNFTNPELVEYAEYVGSVNDRELIYEDYWAFEDRGNKMIVRFSYRAAEQADVLPVFVEMLRSIRYVPELPE